MKRKISILFCILVVCQGQLDDTFKIQPRLIGLNVNPTAAAQDNNNVAFFTRDSPDSAICSGAVVHYTWILTTASCIKKNVATGIRYKVGGPLVAPASGSKATHFSEGRRISKIVIHPYYFDLNRANDIALVNTLEIMPITTYPYTITKTNPNELNAAVVLRGYGPITAANDEPITEALTEAKTTLTNIEHCRTYDSTIPLNKLCSLRGRICQGDQGGPLVLRSNPNELIGIISVSAGTEYVCGLGTKPVETYTNVFLYRDWIVETTGVTAI